MIIYFAGNGLKAEHLSSFYDYENWGVLMSYKDLKNKNNDGTDRFKKFISKHKNENK